MIDAAVLDACAAGEISPEVALARLLLSGAAPDPAALAAAARPGPLQALADLAARHRGRLEPLSALAGRGFDPTGPDPVAASAVLFDRLAAEAPEAAVAFYAFGDPVSLDAATAELLAVIRAWSPPADKRVLDYGCGIGRVALPLAEEAASVWALDVSPGMIAAARERPGAERVRFDQANGRDLAGVTDASVDLVLAVDSWPFLVPAGADAVERLAADIARVLAPGGDWLIFNYSYRGDPNRDDAEVRALAQRYGFEVRRAKEQPFRIWDGLGFHLRRTS